MAIEKLNDCVVLIHPSGSSVTVLYYGATVISWTLANGTENLFLSRYPVAIIPTTVPQNLTDQKLYEEEFHWYIVLWDC